MANIEIHCEDMEGRYFPPLCMRCAKPIKTVIFRRFFCNPLDEGLLGTKYSLRSYGEHRVAIPVCGWHRHMWRTQAIMTALALLTPLVCVVAAFFILAMFHQPQDEPAKSTPLQQLLGGLCGLGTVGSLLIALVSVFTWRFWTIRVLDFKKHSIVLSGVAEKFVQAFQDQKEKALPDSEPDRPATEGIPRKRKPDLRFKLQAWGGTALVFGTVAIILPKFGLQFGILNKFGENAPIAGFGIAAFGCILLFVSANMRKKQDDEQEPEE